MTDRLGSQIRRYYEAITPRVDPHSVDVRSRHPARRSRGIMAAVVTAVVAAIVIGVVPLLLSGDDSTSNPTTSTTSTSTTSTTIDPQAFERIRALDLMLAEALEEVEATNDAWEARTALFDATLAAFSRVSQSVALTEQAAKGDLRIPGLIGGDHVELVAALERLVDAAEALVVGIQAPDDGTLRRDALEAFRAEVATARGILAPYLEPDDEPIVVPGADNPTGVRVVSSDGTLLGVVTASGDLSSTSIEPRVVLTVRDALLADSRFGLGATYGERLAAVTGCRDPVADCPGSSLTIVTTLDLVEQRRAQEKIEEWLPWGSGLPTAAIVMIENGSGAIRVVTDGVDFGTGLDAGERPYDLATRGLRAPGSAFLPVTLVAALEQGISLNSYWDHSTPQVIDAPVLDADAGPWECANAGDNEPGVQTLEEAAYRHTQTVMCQVSVEVGGEALVDAAQRLGFTGSFDPIPQIGIGFVPVRVLDMATAYSTVANQGTRTDPYLIERIEGAGGEVLYQHQVTGVQALAPAVAAAVINTLEKVITVGTGRNAFIGRPQFGKTGSVDRYSDAWFVGAVPRYTTAVWVGFPDGQVPMQGLTIRGQFVPRVFGSTVPAPMWAEFMAAVLGGTPVEDFPSDPPGTAAFYAVPLVTVPDVTGLEYAAAADLLRKLGLDVETPSAAASGTVGATDPEAGSVVSQGTLVVLGS